MNTFEVLVVLAFMGAILWADHRNTEASHHRRWWEGHPTPEEFDLRAQMLKESHFAHCERHRSR